MTRRSILQSCLPIKHVLLLPRPIADSGHSTLREHNDLDTESEAHYDDDLYRHRMFTPKPPANRLVEETDVSTIWLKWKEYVVKKTTTTRTLIQFKMLQF